VQKKKGERRKMKKLVALMMIGAFILAVLPTTMAYYPTPPMETPEFAKSINGEWSVFDDPVVLEGLQYCETVEVTVWALWFEDLYAYDFTLTWTDNGTLTGDYLTLVEAEVKHIHSADFVIASEINNTLDFYHQAVTAIAPAEGWGDGESMIEIANLYFHVDNDAQWPDSVIITFCFGPDNDLTEASDSCTTPIDHEAQRAYLALVPCQPTISMIPPIIYKSVEGETFEVQFQIECAVKMKSFHFYVTWDPEQLTTDAQNVWIKDFLPPPYEYTTVVVGEGELEIAVQMPCEKPLRNGTGELFGIRFTALNPWPDAVPEYVSVEDDHPIWFPLPCWNYINIAGWIDKDADGLTWQYLGEPNGVTVMGPDPFDLDDDEDTKFIYDYTCEQEGYIVGYYEFRAIPGDLNLDGHVDVEDLSAIAKAYGDTDYFDLNGDGIVDIYDIVIVAKNYCRTEPDPLNPWPIFDP
jgi:hypothetical protein